MEKNRSTEIKTGTEIGVSTPVTALFVIKHVNKGPGGGGGGGGGVPVDVKRQQQ